MYDVIVIGAGPAGCTASKVLAENGYDVLLVEKCQMPRYKSCSGQLIKKSLDLVQKYYGEPVPESVACSPIVNKGMIFTDDEGKAYRFEQEGLNVWRSSFDKWLADKAMLSGVIVRDQTVALSCDSEEDYVSVKLKNDELYEEKARYVIDCEGATGVLKKRILGCDLLFIYTYQTFNIGQINLNHQFFHAYLQPELSEYDAWFNVKDNQLVLGVSVKNKDRTQYYYSQFLEYMIEQHSLKIEKQLKEDRWVMPYIQPECSIDFGMGRVMFAGEIAGFLNPMGEGVSAGLESGYCIAKAIAQNFNDPDGVYREYKNNASDLCNYMKRQWAFVGKMAKPFSNMVR